MGKQEKISALKSSSTYSNYDVNKVFNYAAKEKHDEHFLNFLNEEDDFKTVSGLPLWVITASINYLNRILKLQ